MFSFTLVQSFEKGKQHLFGTRIHVRRQLSSKVRESINNAAGHNRYPQEKQQSFV